MYQNTSVFKVYILCRLLSEKKSKLISLSLRLHCNFPDFRIKTASFGKIPHSSEKNIKSFLRVYKPLFHSVFMKGVWDYYSENPFTKSPPDQYETTRYRIVFFT